MFDRLLIANRGEIACRVMATAARHGIRSIAVYSEADVNARHVGLADEAFLIGPAPAAESYLNINAILAAAKRGGAQAIHPGYGFLAENADFAEAVEAAGLVFVGPPPAAIRAMGSKSQAKAIMEKSGVPLVPGYHGANQGAAHLKKAAAKIGYPVMIKASAGGGGKGMRLVERQQDFGDALAAAQREAAKAFGDDRVLIERYLTSPRHIEVQVFADAHGNTVHLFERDCSVQRRHQKVIEEAPAPGIDEAQRAEVGRAAVAAAEAIGYRGAGTVEFIAEEGAFYFMEMNTRLQVEHPVTEMITGQDLVEWQLRVAAGEPLPCAQDEITMRGHAFEARLYAEDPDRDFLPATGRLDHLRFPTESRHVRVDTGVEAGDAISVHYDPLIAKLVVWGRDRGEAIRRLCHALADTEVLGLTTNRAFLAALAAHPAFAAGAVDTGFIARYRDDLLPGERPAPDGILALAALATILRRAADAQRRAAQSSDPHSPWHWANGWRLNSGTHSRLIFQNGGREVPVSLYFERRGYRIELDGKAFAADGAFDDAGLLRAVISDSSVEARVIERGSDLTVICDGAQHQLRLRDPHDIGADEVATGGGLTAPMPGKVISVLVQSGHRVARGQPLISLEAMKMEHTITAPGDGTVSAVHFATGDLVDEGVELISFEADPS